MVGGSALGLIDELASVLASVLTLAMLLPLLVLLLVLLLLRAMAGSSGLSSEGASDLRFAARRSSLSFRRQRC